MLRRLIVVAALSGGYAAGAATTSADLAQAPVNGATDGVSTSETRPAETGAPAAEARGRDAPVSEATVPDGSKADAPRVNGKGPRHSQRLTPEQVIDERVRRLAKSLELDETQRARLREVFENERRQIRKVWSENPQPNADRVGPTLAILDRTREEIRAMLNEEQKKKYPAAVPRNSTAPANADVEYWMRLTQPPPRQGAEQGH